MRSEQIEGLVSGEFSLAPANARGTSQLGAWCWDIPGGRVDLSDHLREICGLEAGQHDGTLQEFLQIVHPEDRDRVWSELQMAVLHRVPFSWRTRIQRPDGAERSLLVEGSARESVNGTVDELIGICQEVSVPPSEEPALARLERLLTDIIANHPAMISIKDLDLRYRTANQDVAALFGLPLDQVIGHTASELLPSVGPAIDAQAAEAIATLETIHSDIEFDIAGELRTFHLVSFALTDHTNQPVEVCCIATDVTDNRREQQANRLRSEASKLIWSALSEDRMVVVSQPVVEITTQNPVSEELLIRLALPSNGGLLQPSAFLPVAERFDLIQDIDTWMVSRAIAIAGHRAVQVNLSAVTLSDAAARERILSMVASRPASAARIVFEITETAAAHHFDAAREFAAALTKLGCGLALDDFGTGFGSFTYLRHLPLRYLKIDRSFVTNLPNSVDDRRVVSSIIGIARQFNLLTIAEGIEDARTLDALDNLGADFAQGFYLGRPTPLRS